MVTVKQQLLLPTSHSCWIWDDYHQLISNARPWNNNFVRLPVFQKKNSIFLHEKSQILKSNFEGFSETKSRKKQLISHEMHRNFQGNFEMLFTRQAVSKFTVNLQSYGLQVNCPDSQDKFKWFLVHFVAFLMFLWISLDFADLNENHNLGQCWNNHDGFGVSVNHRVHSSSITSKLSKQI